ncbi:MAG: inosine/xanthosine triphosphatase, partial [Candidatus Hodarchaeales archaeon]
MVVKIIVGSKNPVKVQATNMVFEEVFKKVKIDACDVSEFDPSETVLKPQPIGEQETYEASRWRVRFLQERFPEYDYFVGIEGGITESREGQARIILYSSIANNENIITVRGCEIPLPLTWFDELKRNSQLELGDVASRMSGVENIKRKQGAVGYFTNNRIKRVDILRESLL